MNKTYGAIHNNRPGAPETMLPKEFIDKYRTLADTLVFKDCYVTDLSDDELLALIAYLTLSNTRTEIWNGREWEIIYE